MNPRPKLSPATSLLRAAAAITAISGFGTSSHAAIIVAEWLEVSAAVGVSGNVGNRQDISLSGAGYGFTITNDPTASLGNPLNSFFTAASAGSRYLRLSLDFRSYDFMLRSGAGTGFNFYTPLGTNSTPDNFLLNNDSDGWSTALVATFDGSGGISTTITAATGDGTPPGGYSISNGLSASRVNWLMLRPDSASSAAPLQADNTAPFTTAGIVATAQAQRAVAFGFLWTDANTNGLLDGGDAITSRWLVTATSFAEMDTVAELNAAVIPEPGTFAALAGLGALACAALRRRRFTTACH